MSSLCKSQVALAIATAMIQAGYSGEDVGIRARIAAEGILGESDAAPNDSPKMSFADVDRAVQGADISSVGYYSDAHRPSAVADGVNRTYDGQVHLPLKLTDEDIGHQIIANKFWSVPDSTTTVCAITLRNGCVVIGSSACVSRETYNETIGRDLAFEDAKRQIWQLEGYLLLERKRRQSHAV